MLQLTTAGEASMAPPAPAPSDPSVSVWREEDGTVVGLGQTIGDRDWLHLPRLGAFSFRRESGTVKAFPEPGADPALVQDAFRRMVLPLALQARGREVLHASAVRTEAGAIALCAVSGTGKSTLACALSGRGHTLWADDAVPFEISDGGPRALPLPFTLRLRPASAAFFGDAAADGVHVMPGPEPLAAVFVLERGTDDRAELERLAPADAFPAVLTHGYCFSMNDQARTGAMVNGYLELVERMPVFRLTFPEGLDGLEHVLDLIEGAVG